MQIVLVHGYLGHRALFWPMLRALNNGGYKASTYGYPSHRDDLRVHANGLLERLQRIDGPFAVVAHSMGGLVAHAALARANAPRAQRLVLIATPHGGCEAARKIRGPLAALMSPGIRRTSRSMTPRADAERIGVIVGSRDRTVRPHEADWDKAHDRVRLPFGHNQLLMKRETANAVLRFVRDGRFETPLKDVLGIV